MTTTSWPRSRSSTAQPWRWAATPSSSAPARLTSSGSWTVSWCPTRRSTRPPRRRVAHTVGRARRRSDCAWSTDGAYVNVHVGGIIRAADEGWTATIDLYTDVHQVAVDGGTVFAALGDGGLATSDDGGNTWSIHTGGLHATYARGVAVLGDHVLLSASNGPFATEGAVYRRERNGEHFERLGGGCRSASPATSTRGGSPATARSPPWPAPKARCSVQRIPGRPGRRSAQGSRTALGDDRRHALTAIWDTSRSGETAGGSHGGTTDPAHRRRDRRRLVDRGAAGRGGNGDTNVTALDVEPVGIGFGVMSLLYRLADLRRAGGRPGVGDRQDRPHPRGDPPGRPGL